jgi:hypothetical protein
MGLRQNSALCGASGNCATWFFRRSHAKWQLLLDGFWVRLLFIKPRPNGLLGLALVVHFQFLRLKISVSGMSKGHNRAELRPATICCLYSTGSLDCMGSGCSNQQDCPCGEMPRTTGVVKVSNSVEAAMAVPTDRRRLCLLMEVGLAGGSIGDRGTDHTAAYQPVISGTIPVAEASQSRLFLFRNPHTRIASHSPSGWRRKCFRPLGGSVADPVAAHAKLSQRGDSTD